MGLCRSDIASVTVQTPIMGSSLSSVERHTGPPCLPPKPQDDVAILRFSSFIRQLSCPVFSGRVSFPGVARKAAVIAALSATLSTETFSSFSLDKRTCPIDVETGDYAIADDLLAAGDMVRARHPDAIMRAGRIGYNAVYAIGGTLTRTAKL
jgi:hypothetical protein